MLACAVGATLLAWLLFTFLKLLPETERARQLVGTTEEIVDLAAPVDPERDHTRGPLDAPVTLVEYGDFECPYCGLAEPVVRELLADHDEDVLFVFRHLPLTDVHAYAQLAAEASEAAAAQGRFWEMHDLLLANQDALEPRHLVGYAEQLGLDVDRFRDELRRRVHAPRVAEDVADADASQVTGTPTFFINGLRHHGAYDMATLEAAIRAARQRRLAARPEPRAADPKVRRRVRGRFPSASVLAGLVLAGLVALAVVLGLAQAGDDAAVVLAAVVRRRGRRGRVRRRRVRRRLRRRGLRGAHGGRDVEAPSVERAELAGRAVGHLQRPRAGERFAVQRRQRLGRPVRAGERRAVGRADRRRGAVGEDGAGEVVAVAALAADELDRTPVGSDQGDRQVAVVGVGDATRCGP